MAQVLLLRGVNVGGRRLVVAAMRALLAEIGAGEVRSHSQSGNFVFTGALTREAVAAAMAARPE
jgi:uncharacterized protein (DUF1697 family)